MTKEDLEDIIDGCRKGNRLSQKALYRQFYRYGMNVCNRYAKTEAEAEEMLNDAFLRIFIKINLYDPTLSFVGWLHTIVVRSAINYLKKYQNKPLVSEIDLPQFYDLASSENIINDLSADELIVLVRQLPPSYRAAFNLAAIEGYSHVEIAAMLGISEGTSRSNLKVARQKLQIMVSQSNIIKQ